MAKQKKPSKSVTVTKMLSRGIGATVAEIMKSTGWKEHSCRAFLTGVRKTSKLLKEQRHKKQGHIAARERDQSALLDAERDADGGDTSRRTRRNSRTTILI